MTARRPDDSRISPTVERPADAAQTEPRWGSDIIADVLRRLGVEYLSLNPGASYRGLHDSVVNRLGNEHPRMILCLHEEHAVAIAHGYAKVTGRPMAVALHSNVGLMHASMAVFNAYCDRVPMLLLGATGPMDAAQRRPWIDWLHTSSDQAALVRPFTKWDDQPASVEAAVESLARAFTITSSTPSAPTYVCFDVATQETDDLGRADVSVVEHLLPDRPVAPTPETIGEIDERVRAARRPLMLIGRVSRAREAWDRRVALAEAWDIEVMTHLKLGAAFPVTHRLHQFGPVSHRVPWALEKIREADLIVSLNWLDLGGTLTSAGLGHPGQRPDVISFSPESRLADGWNKDHFAFPYATISVEADPDVTVEAVVRQIDLDVRPAATSVTPATPPAPAGRTHGRLRLYDVASAVRAATADHRPSFIRLPTAWPADHMLWEDPLDFLGVDGGEGIGSGPGMAVGGALALSGGDRLPVAILGDGDFAMGATALWTAAHYEVPLLMIIANNRSYLNDEIHQSRIARHRDRPTENAWVGQRMTEPDLDLAGLAHAQGWEGLGPIEDTEALRTALESAVASVLAGGRVLVDARIEVELDRAPLGPDRFSTTPASARPHPSQRRD